jgi:hypothetical protein
VYEAIATQGDVRRHCDLFGISVPTAQRYVDIITKPKDRDFTDVIEAMPSPLDLHIV